MKQPCVYILCNRTNGVLYIGVTSALPHRMDQHSQGLIEGFTKRYAVKRLVYYEMHDTMHQGKRCTEATLPSRALIGDFGA
jgi:putative endonuclease